MKVNEIKKTIEQVVRVEYIAEDGTVFYNEEECKKYEESANAIIGARFRKMAIITNPYHLFNSGDEDRYCYIVNVKNSEDLDILRRYVLMREYGNSAKEEYAKQVIEHFPDEIIGKTIIVDGGYENDWFYSMGTIEEYISGVQKRYEETVNPKKEEPKDATH